MKRRRASRAASSAEVPPSRGRASLLESLSEGVASIWPREAKTPPSRDSIQSTVLVTQDGEERLKAPSKSFASGSEVWRQEKLLEEVWEIGGISHFLMSFG